MGQDAQNWEGHGLCAAESRQEEASGPGRTAANCFQAFPGHLPRIPDPKCVGAWAAKHFTFIISVLPKC